MQRNQDFQHYYGPPFCLEEVSTFFTAETTKFSQFTEHIIEDLMLHDSDLLDYRWVTVTIAIIIAAVSVYPTGRGLDPLFQADSAMFKLHYWLILSAEPIRRQLSLMFIIGEYRTIINKFGSQRKATPVYRGAYVISPA